MKTIKIILLALGLTVAHVCCAQQSPVPMLENSSEQIMSVLKENKAAIKGNHQIIYQAIQRYLLPHVDLYGMSRSVLGRQAWNKATAAEKKEFSYEFTQLIIRTYATPLAEYSGETIKYLPLRDSLDSRFIHVNCVVLKPNGQKIPLTYSLVNKNSEWKIYDLSVEGVSLLQSFKNQFGDMLQNTSMQALIKQMHETKKAA